MSAILISSIAAMSENRVIGVNNTLPWHIPEDFRFFKQTTLGHPIIMGRKSYESLGKPLPGRPNLVISRSQSFAKIDDMIGPFVFETFDDAAAFAKERARQDGKSEIFITGGGEIYRQTLSLVDRLYLTVIHRVYQGDVFFPDFDWADWRVTRQDRRDGDPAFTFFTLEKNL